MDQKTVEHIPESKIKVVDELTNLIKTKKTILIADIGNIPGSQFQQISKKLRGKAVVKVPKKNLLFRALDASKNKTAVGLKEHVDGQVALLFSDLDSYELAEELLNNKSPTKAKTGQTAPRDIEVPAGPTDLIPGPAISELGSLGIQIQIKGGKIEIKEPKVVAEEGKEISQGAANILSKLDIKPFTIGFTPLSAYDSQDDLIYLEIKIDKEGTLDLLKESYSKGLAFAMEVGYITGETVKLMIQKAGSHENKLIRTIKGEPEEVAPVSEDTSVAEDKPKEEEKKEAPVDFGASFF